MNFTNAGLIVVDVIPPQRQCAPMAFTNFTNAGLIVVNVIPPHRQCAPMAFTSRIYIEIKVTSLYNLFAVLIVSYGKLLHI